MKKLIMLFFLIGACNACLAQNKVQKAQAFFTVSIPGMQRMDVNGNKIDPEPIYNRFIFLECRYEGKPKVDTVFYNGIVFKASVADKEETELTIGIRTDDGRPVIANPKKGNHIWKIDLIPLNGKALQHQAVKKILVKGMLNKTKFTYTIASETELTAPDMY